MTSSDENRFGFANGDESTSIFAVKAEPIDVFACLSEYIDAHSYTPEVLGERVNLFTDDIVTYIYQSFSSEWTIVAPYYESYFCSSDRWRLLPIVSTRMGSATIVCLDATEDYIQHSYYENGCLAECVRLDGIKFKGYEDFKSLADVEKLSTDTGKALDADYYFHHINRNENSNQLVIGRFQAADLTSSFMKRENLYVPYFDIVRQPVVDELISLSFDDIKVGDFKSFGLFYIRPQ